MNHTQEMVETLKAGHRIELVLARNEPIQNAHALFNRLKREHGLRIGRRSSITPQGVSFVIWSEEHLRSEVMGY